MTAGPQAQWVHSEALRAALVAAGRRLEPHGIELLAVKGAHLVHALGMDPAVRRMLDADAIVIRGSFVRATNLLESSGEWQAHEGWSSRTLSRAGTAGGVIDLHRMALPLFFGRMRSAALRARAVRHAAFEKRVFVPDPVDAACLAIAHYVKDCMGTRGHGGLARDLAWLAERAEVRPLPLAERLREHGLRFVGLAGLLSLADCDARWVAWADALCPTPSERLAGRWAVNVVRRFAPDHPDLAFLFVRSLADDVATGACGFAATSARFARDFLIRTGKRWTLR